MAKNDFLLNIGFKIDTKSIQKGALRAALNKAADGLTLKISKVKLSNPAKMRKEIAQQLGTVQLGALSVSSNAAKSLARSIQDKTKPTIKSLTVSPTSLSNLRKSVERALSNVQVSVNGLGGGGRGASSGGARSSGSRTRQTIAGEPAAYDRSAEGIKRRAAALVSNAEADREAFVAMGNTNRAILRSAQSFKQAGVNAEELGLKIGQVTKRFIEYAASVKLVQTAQAIGRQLVEGTVELDSAVQDLAKVGSVTKDINKGFQAISSVALTTGRSIQDVSDAVGEFVRQGKNLEDASKAAAQALQLSNVSALNGADAARLVTAAQQVFGSTAEQLGSQLSSLAVFADSSATNVTEIGQAFLRAASSAKTGGFTLEETFAALAATLEQTRLQSATVGTALKTIVARLGRDRQKVADLANSFTGLREGQAGFVDSSGTVRDILNQLGENFDKLTLRQKQQLALSVAGVRQGNVFIGMLDNFSKTQELVNKSQTDSTAINEKNQRQLEKLETRFLNLQTALKAFGGSIAGLDSGEQGGIAGIASDSIGSLTDLLGVVPSAINEMNNLSDSFNIGTTASTAAIGAVIGSLREVAKVAANSAKKFFDISKNSVSASEITRKAEQLKRQEIDKTTESINRQAESASRAVTRSTKGANLPNFVGNLASRKGKGGLSSALGLGEGALGRGAARGAVGFGLIDFGNQLVESSKAAREEANARREAMGLNAQSATLFQEITEKSASSLSSIATAALLFGPLGALVAGLGGVIKVATDAVKEHAETVQSAQASIADQQVGVALLDLRLRVADATKETVNYLKTLTSSTSELVRSNEAQKRFSSALTQTTEKMKTAFETQENVLKGLTPEFARLEAQIASGRRQLEGVSNESGVSASDIAKTIADFGTGALSNDLSADTFNREIDNALKNIAEQEADTIANREKEAKIMEEVVGSFDLMIRAVDDAARNLNVGTDFAIAARNEVFKQINSSAISDEGKRAARASFDKATSNELGSTGQRGKRGFTTTEAFNQALKSRAGKETELLEKQREAIARESESLSKQRSSLEKFKQDSEKENNELLLKQVQLELKRNLLLGQTSDVIDQSNRKLQQENDTIAQQIAQRSFISSLKEGDIEQQKQAILLQKTFAALEDESLKKAKQRLQNLKEAGAAQADIARAESEVGGIEQTLRQRAAIQAQPEIAALDQAQQEKERANRLKEIEELTSDLNETERDRTKALSKLQSANKEVFDAQRKLSDATKSVQDAFLQVAASQKALSDEVKKRTESIRSSIRSALEGVGFENISNSARALADIVSTEQRLAIVRKEGLEQSLKIAQEQASTLFSIGERLATGGPGARAELQRGLSTAQAISGGASISGFSPDDIKLALQNADLFPGLREEITRQSLSQVGLEDELNQLKGTIASGTEEQAREQAAESIRLAEAQLANSFQSLVEQEAIKKSAQEDLALSKDQVKRAQIGLDLARQQVRSANGALTEARYQSNRLDRISAQMASFVSAANKISSASASVDNAARGTLSSAEMNGLAEAAKREKALMPAGSKLMLANTSETVLTAKQSKRLGIGARSQSNAANGNGDFSGLFTALSQISSSLDLLQRSINAGGVNNVNLQVDTNKNINIKGIEGLDQRLKSQLEGKFATGNDVNAIQSAILDIISKLGENGLADDLGR